MTTKTRPTLEYVTEVDGHKVTVVLRPRRWETYRQYNASPRLYPDFEESLFDNLVNRRSRPIALLGRVARQALKQLELPGTLRWSQYAGCSCPCSPGWRWHDAPSLDFGEGHMRAQYDGWVEIKGAPQVAATPQALENQRSRATAFVNDRTLDVDQLVGTRL